MSKLSVLLALVVVAVPVASASLPYSLPPLASLSVLANGGFEAGLSGWIHYHGGGFTGPAPSIAAGGADGTANAVLITNQVPTSNVLLQYFAPLTSTAIALDFHARVTVQRLADGGQGLALFHNFNQPGGALLGGLGFYGNPPTFGFGAFGAGGSVPQPLDGGWHQYSWLLMPSQGITVMSLDGLPVAVTRGTPATTTINSLYFGDGWGGDVASGKGAASDMQWDEFYLEPIG